MNFHKHQQWMALVISYVTSALVVLTKMSTDHQFISCCFRTRKRHAIHKRSYTILASP